MVNGRWRISTVPGRWFYGQRITSKPQDTKGGKMLTQKEKKKLYDKKYRRRNLTRIKERSLFYRLVHKKDKKKYDQKYFQSHKEKWEKATKESKLWIDLLKSELGCANCGETHPACLDFHHKNPKIKKEKVSRLVNRVASRDRVLKEISRCDLLCANCHRKKHYRCSIDFVTSSK